MFRGNWQDKPINPPTLWKRLVLEYQDGNGAWTANLHNE
jgi:hypothetical protein